MLRIANLEEIDGLLLRVPELIDRLENHLPSFVENVRHWLKEMEQTLENNRMPIVGNIASLRGLLSSAEQGFVPPEFEFKGRPTRRRILNAVSSDALRRASAMVSDAVQPDRDRIAEAERVCRQVVAHGKAKNLLPNDGSCVETAEHLGGVWRRLTRDPDLRQFTTHLEGLLGPIDVLVVLNRTMTADSGGSAHRALVAQKR